MSAGVPDPPTDFHIARILSDRNVMVEWTPPRVDELDRNNGVQITGYKVRMTLGFHIPPEQDEIDEMLFSDRFELSFASLGEFREFRLTSAIHFGIQNVV